MSLKLKLIISVLLTILTILSVCTFFTYISVQSFTKNSESLTKGLSGDVQRDVSGFASHYAGTLTYHENVNVATQITNLLNNGKTALLAAAQFDEVYSSNTSDIESLFDKLSKENGVIHSFLLATPNQQPLAYSPKDKIPISSINNQQWFDSAAKLKKNSFSISNAYLNENNNNYYITISTPLYKNDTFFGVIACELSLQNLLNHISQTKVGKTGYVILTDPKGILLAYKDSNLVQKKINISSLPIFKEKTNNTTFLDNEKISYIGQIHKETGWEMYSIISQDEIQSFSKTISKNMSSRIADAEKDTETIFSKLFTIQVIVICVVVCVAIVISFLFSRYFINPINKLSSLMHTVAKGDLTKTMPKRANDELGSLFNSVNEMIINFREMVSKIHILVKQAEKDSISLNNQSNISSTATEVVSATMVQVLQGSEKLSDEMINITHNVESNVAAVQMMSNNIDTIVNRSQETKQTTSQGKIAMENLNKKMSHISEQAIESSNIMKELDRKLQTINEISSLIHGLSEQTNLLALNASIEAARAGEHGRGFSVVAQEVKKLAVQSSTSVDEIATIIHEIQQDSSKALENIEHGNIFAREGAQLSKETESILLQTIRFMNHLSKDIEEIAVANDLLNNSSQSISFSVDSVVAVSEQTSKGVQDVTNTSTEQQKSIEEVQQISNNLRMLTKELKESIDRFHI
nr:methyl-accepting chemotaxis protein [Bacillus massiliigorillae]